MSDYSLTCETPSCLYDDECDFQLQELDLEISLLIDSTGKQYKPHSAHQTLKVVKWPVIRTLSAKSPNEFEHLAKDLRLPHLESSSPSRDIMLDIDGIDARFEESGYIINVLALCSDGATELTFEKELSRLGS